MRDMTYGMNVNKFRTDVTKMLDAYWPPSGKIFESKGHVIFLFLTERQWQSRDQ